MIYIRNSLVSKDTECQNLKKNFLFSKNFENHLGYLVKPCSSETSK